MVEIHRFPHVGSPHGDIIVSIDWSPRKHQQFEEARKVFTDIHAKQLDWPEAIWEAWVSFEHLHGTLEEVESCLDKIEKAQYQTNARRAKVSLLGFRYFGVC